MRNLRVFHLMLLLACLTLLITGCPRKNDKPTPPPNPHVEAAIKHAKIAINHGKNGNWDGLHLAVKEALTHAKAAQQEINNPHLDAAIEELEKADAATSLEAALSHTESALKHLKEIK